MQKQRYTSAYWWGPNVTGPHATNVTNFGDYLTPLLLRKFCNVWTQWKPANQAALIGVGSTLEHLSWNYSGIILGTGLLHENSLMDFENADVRSLRGPLSANTVLHNNKNVVYGDLGLLADHLALPSKTHDLGILPHWSDTVLATRKEFLVYEPLIIDPQDDPVDVVNQIGSVRKLVTSSLHGAIVADAYGISRRVEMAPNLINDVEHEGGDFKWRDYHASIDMEFVVGVTDAAPRQVIQDKQDELFEMLYELRKDL